MRLGPEHGEPQPAAVPPDGTVVEVDGRMPGVPAGTRAVVRHQSPAGHSNLPRLVWLELDEPIIWSHGVSEAAGYWGSAAEFTVVGPEHSDPQPYVEPQPGPPETQVWKRGLEEAHVHVDERGIVQASEAAMAQLLLDAGWERSA